VAAVTKMVTPMETQIDGAFAECVRMTGVSRVACWERGRPRPQVFLQQSVVGLGYFDQLGELRIRG
jgi:hypothetical protein